MCCGRGGWSDISTRRDPDLVSKQSSSNVPADESLLEAPNGAEEWEEAGSRAGVVLVQEETLTHLSLCLCFYFNLAWGNCCVR